MKTLFHSLHENKLRHMTLKFAYLRSEMCVMLYDIVVSYHWCLVIGALSFIEMHM